MCKYEDKIRDRTGLGIGMVEIRGNLYNVYCKDENKAHHYIYDCNKANFHFLPELKEAKKAYENISSYLKTVSHVQKKIKESIEQKEISYDCRTVGNGRLYQYPLDYGKEYNSFFKYITINIDGRWYTINFMRWYIDKKKNVNCRFGEIQFDKTMNKNKYVNTAQYREKDKIKKKDIIYYPNAYKAQSEKMIRLNGKYQVCVYNPKNVGDIWQIKEKDAYDIVVDEFIKFIDKVKKQATIE